MLNLFDIPVPGFRQIDLIFEIQLPTRTSHWGQHLIAAVGQTDSSAAVIRKRLTFECVLRLFSGSTKSEPICLPKLRNYTTQFRP